MLLSTHALTYFFMISRTKYTKNVLVGSLAALVRDEIQYNEYPGTRRVMSIGYPGSKFSTRFNPNSHVRFLWAHLRCPSQFSTGASTSWSYYRASLGLHCSNLVSNFHLQETGRENKKLKYCPLSGGRGFKPRSGSNLGCIVLLSKSDFNPNYQLPVYQSI